MTRGSLMEMGYYVLHQDGGLFSMTYGKEKRDKFIEMRAEGLTLAKIAEELKISYNTAVDWSREFVDNISAIKAFKDEEMIEKYRMTKEKRIEMYGERLLAIQDELAKRDLSDIPTHKLFDMTIKCSKALEAEAVDLFPIFLTDDDIAQEKERRKLDLENAIKREEIRRNKEEFDLSLGIL
jgi:hypothetical protein